MLNWLFNPTNEKGFQEDDDDGVVDPAVLPSLFPNSDNLISIDDWSGRTLSSLITRALPSGQIQPPKVIIMGAQSSGKTLLIISMVFYYLQHVPSLTPDMGERLLSIFRTGTGMVTKRPIEIHLLNTDTNTCKLKLELSGVTAEFPSAEFDAILTTNGNTEELHMAPLRVYICAKELPNIDFLDMPGITAEDKQFVDAEGITRKPCTVRTLAKSFAEDTNSTIVLVENSILSLDLDNCQLLPLLK
ncbi:hypothetical protein EON65_12065 [archaeon]|nr:MAG: hypothetical protein EON65_12065 [archaeon]